MEYAREAERGLESHEDAWSPGEFRYSFSNGQDALMVVTTEGSGYFDSAYLLNAERKRRQALLTGWEASDDVTHHLILAADQFLVDRQARRAARKPAKVSSPDIPGSKIGGEIR